MKFRNNAIKIEPYEYLHCLISRIVAKTVEGYEAMLPWEYEAHDRSSRKSNNPMIFWRFHWSGALESLNQIILVCLVSTFPNQNIRAF